MPFRNLIVVDESTNTAERLALAVTMLRRIAATAASPGEAETRLDEIFHMAERTVAQLTAISR